MTFKKSLRCLYSTLYSPIEENKVFNMVSLVFGWYSLEYHWMSAKPDPTLDILWCFTKRIRAWLKIVNFVLSFGPLVSKMNFVTRVLGSWGSSSFSSSSLRYLSYDKYLKKVLNKASFLCRYSRRKLALWFQGLYFCKEQGQYFFVFSLISFSENNL